MSGDPELMTRSNGGYVPMALYLADRREAHEWMSDLSADVKTILSRLDRDDGASSAEERADAQQADLRRTRGERAWDVVRTVLAAVVGALATIGVAGFR